MSVTTWIVSLRKDGTVLGPVDALTYGEAMGKACVLASSSPHPPQALRLQPVGGWPSVVKTCSRCSKSYDVASWLKLKYVGRQDDDIDRLDLRNCACGSTLALNVEALEASS